MKLFKPALLILPFTFLLISCAQPEPADKVAQSITGEEVVYTAGEITMNGYIAYDESSENVRPGILVVHEWWGHNEHARNSAEKLAEMGYVALAVDMYGDGQVAQHPEEAMEFSGSVMGNFDTAQARFNAALETLKDHPLVDAGQTGAIGYCFGGSLILAMANTGADLDAVAAFHAGLQLPVMPQDEIQSRILILNGAEDPLISAEDVENLTGALERVNADFRYVNYEGATHAYTNPAADSLGVAFGLPLAYNADVDSLSWQEMNEFFDQTFNGETP
ncbi:dienelactone hydrolase family protein [Rhodohalobacter mucosus]|uniref:Dienelactone hydrolase n=1 Tax=Rhodohalobacter mucosus TaxID=2079485 RepID=A0A316TQT9_9BACT|nr:dienelactone hydrolase family protein [Rhodohalobacter mucosus]PWN06158.1 dienelactone hydrolase [Rhodohalobacter mucosus]